MKKVPCIIRNTGAATKHWVHKKKVSAKEVLEELDNFSEEIQA